jgi:hypothetical protein
MHCDQMKMCFIVTVGLALSTGCSGDCIRKSDCNDGYYCDNGVCVAEGGGDTESETASTPADVSTEPADSVTGGQSGTDSESAPDSGSAGADTATDTVTDSSTDISTDTG